MVVYEILSNDALLIIIVTSMTSYEKRKALVNELRSAHFPFGFQSNHVSN